MQRPSRPLRGGDRDPFRRPRRSSGSSSSRSRRRPTPPRRKSSNTSTTKRRAARRPADLRASRASSSSGSSARCAASSPTPRAPSGRLATTAYGGGLIAVATLMIGFGLAAVGGAAPGRRGAELTRALIDASLLVPAVGAPAAAVFFAANSLSIMRSGTCPPGWDGSAWSPPSSTCSASARSSPTTASSPATASSASSSVSSLPALDPAGQHHARTASSAKPGSETGSLATNPDRRYVLSFSKLAGSLVLAPRRRCRTRRYRLRQQRNTDTPTVLKISVSEKGKQASFSVAEIGRRRPGRTEADQRRQSAPRRAAGSLTRRHTSEEALKELASENEKTPDWLRAKAASAASRAANPGPRRSTSNRATS